MAGCVYVLEGSALGGQVMAKMAATQLGLSATNGTRFFTGRSAETSPRWRSFGTAMDALPFNFAEREAVIASAAETFRAFEHWLHQVRREVRVA